MTDTRPNVALFVTCLVDLFRPAVGFAAVKLLESGDLGVVWGGGPIGKAFAREVLAQGGRRAPQPALDALVSEGQRR